MFICDNCGNHSANKEKPTKIGIMREKTYSNYKEIFDEKTRRKRKEFYETQGLELSKELNYCKECI